MAIFVIPVALKGAATMIGSQGAKAAIKKYGPKVVKQAQEAMAKRQASITAKVEGKKTGKYVTDAVRNKNVDKMLKEDALLQKRLKNEMNIQSGKDAFKQLDGKIKFSKGGKALYNAGGMVKASMKVQKPN